MCGLGPLQPLVDDPLIGDILVNGPGEIFIEREGRLEPTTVTLGPPARSSASRSGSPPSPARNAGRPPGGRCPDARRVAGQRGDPARRRPVPLDPQVQPAAARPRAGRPAWSQLGRRGWSRSRHGRPHRPPRAGAREHPGGGRDGAGKTTFLRSVTDLFDPAERIGVVEGHSGSSPLSRTPTGSISRRSTRTTSRGARRTRACSMSGTSSRTPSGCGRTG